MPEATQPLTVNDYKSGVRPVWCAGCGNYGTLTAMTQALAELRIDPDKLLVTSGIGCASRFPYFLRAYSLHGVHGRALPVATGMKTYRPDLTVMVIGGDGDGFSIGGGHIPHAARKNVNITYIVANNSVYGLTKGQTSPTTWVGQTTTTSPMGAVDPPINPILMLLGVGASFVARGYSGKPADLRALIVRAVQHKGFSVVEVLTPCPSFNRTLNFQTLNEMVKPLPQDHDPTDLATAMKLALNERDFYTGVFYQVERPTYADLKDTIRERSGAFDDERAGMRELLGEFA
jgi:2-oxoglutarate ferredoxin oxidoreductase subunit beta